MKKVALLALIATPAFANDVVVFENGTGNCPQIVLGVAGDSVVSGIRYTLATRDILVPGTLRMAVGPNIGGNTYPVNYQHVVFTGTLRPEFSSCKADKFFTGPMGSTVRRITLDNGKFRYVFKDGIHVIFNASTFNGQAIVEFAEAM